MILPVLEGLVFAIFHEHKGPIVVEQVPENIADKLVLSFDCIIPKAALCGNLITFPGQCGFRLLGLPTRIEDEKYERNVFIFNLVFVFRDSQDESSYRPIVRKCARILKELEMERSFLSEDIARGGGQIKEILEQILEELNTFFECNVPIDETTWINLKLFPRPEKPREVRPWDVPICMTNLSSLKDRNWDITLLRMLPYLDGINPVSKIAKIADIDILLCIKVVEDLLYHDYVLIIDLFMYSNSYCVLPIFSAFAQSLGTQIECARYISRQDGSAIDFDYVYKLYAALQPSLTVSDWILEQEIDEGRIDVRRMITFGIIKGFLRRVRQFVSLEPQQNSHQDKSNTLSQRPGFERSRTMTVNRLVNFNVATLYKDVHAKDFAQTGLNDHGIDAGKTKDLSDGPTTLKSLLQYIRDGPKETDELCVQFELSCGKIEALLENEPKIRYIWQ